MSDKTVSLDIDSPEQREDYEKLLGPISHTASQVLIAFDLYVEHMGLFDRVQEREKQRKLVAIREKAHEEFLMRTLFPVKQNPQKQVKRPKTSETAKNKQNGEKQAKQPKTNPFEEARKRRREREKDEERAARIARIERNERAARRKAKAALAKKEEEDRAEYEEKLGQAYGWASERAYRANGGDYVFCPTAEELVRMEASRTRPRECAYEEEVDIEEFRGPFNGLLQYYPLDFSDEGQLTVTQSSLGGNMKGDCYYDFK